MRVDVFPVTDTAFPDGWGQERNNWSLADLSKCVLGCVCCAYIYCLLLEHNPLR